jgi:glucose-6-phosphate 1-dehydrogenase (EC 1.1.1.49)
MKVSEGMNTDLLIVGGDGDLALRKLYPSLYFLELNNCMPDNTRIIGMARTGQTRDEFRAKIHTWLKRVLKMSCIRKRSGCGSPIKFGLAKVMQPIRKRLVL